MELNQYNNILNYNNRLLDLILANFTCVVKKSPETLVPEDLHHPSLLIWFEIRISSKKDPNIANNTFYNFKKANLIDVYQKLARIDWNFLLPIRDVNAAMDLFYSKIYSVLDECVPKTKLHSRTYPPWFTHDLIKYIKLKSKAWNDYKKHDDPMALEEFKLLRSYIKTEADNSYKRYCCSIENDIVNNPTKFWHFINIKKRDTAIPSEMSYRDKTCGDGLGVANLFAAFFQNSYSASSDSFIHTLNDSVTDSISLTQFDKRDVLFALKKLKPKYTMGPDKLPSFLIRDCASVFSDPLTLIFNLAIKSNIFPDLLKDSKIIPIYKKGEKQNVENYRPITIINNFSKAFEHVLYNSIYEYVVNKINVCQHGFMRGRSTSSNLICITQYISDAVDNNQQVDVVYTDFTKAFDRLNHSILLSKLEFHGFTANLLKFFETYLIKRKYYVECSGYKSEAFISTSGVPQGSVLGPLLFNLYINDIVTDLNVHYLLYADDMKLYTTISKSDDCLKIQQALNNISQWCHDNDLLLNVEKCNIMTYSLKINNIYYDYSVNGTVLKRCLFFKDLGVTFDSRLSFNGHINHIANECYKCLGYIIRNSREFSNVATLKLLFQSFVMSRLEYACVVWSPNYRIHIDSLEGVQRRFLKFLSYKMDGLYPPIGYSQDTLLRRFSMRSLESRRILAQLIFLHKLINNTIDCSYILAMLNFHVPRLTSRQSHLFYLPTPRTNVKKFSPLYRVCDSYNKVQDQFDIFRCTVTLIKKLTV